jgi:hypothetical protein
MCEKVFTLKLSQSELLKMMPIVLKEFSPIELCQLVPAIGFKNLLLELGYGIGDFVIDSFKDLFNLDTKDAADDGFDFDDADPSTSS